MNISTVVRPWSSEQEFLFIDVHYIEFVTHVGVWLAEFTRWVLFRILAMTQEADPQVIDVDKLERELISALEADRKYSRENDAKFRAVHQKVATYEEFRCAVLLCLSTPHDVMLMTLWSAI